VCARVRSALSVCAGIVGGWLTWAYVATAFSSWSTYAEIFVTISEISIANVIVSDIVYLLIWSLYPEHGHGGAASLHTGPVPAVMTTVVSPTGDVFVVAMPVANANAATKKDRRATQKIHDLDAEFGGERYGKVSESLCLVRMCVCA
jgi:hypothetical protein